MLYEGSREGMVYDNQHMPFDEIWERRKFEASPTIPLSYGIQQSTLHKSQGMKHDNNNTMINKSHLMEVILKLYSGVK